MLNQRFQGGLLPLDVPRPVCRMILGGLSYLQSQCHIVHTGIYLRCEIETAIQLTFAGWESDNILPSLRDHSVMEKVAQEEMNNQLPQKQAENRTIYLSRNEFRLLPKKTKEGQ